MEWREITNGSPTPYAEKTHRFFVGGVLDAAIGLPIRAMPRDCSMSVGFAKTPVVMAAAPGGIRHMCWLRAWGKKIIPRFKKMKYFGFGIFGDPDGPPN